MYKGTFPDSVNKGIKKFLTTFEYDIRDKTIFKKKN